MKTTEFRLGNLISLIYDQEKFGVVVAMDLSGSIHISDRTQPDDVRDVIGVLITETLLEKFGYETVIYAQENEISLEFTDSRVTVTIDEKIVYRLRFFHELQNVVFINTGCEILDPHLVMNRQ